MVTGFIAPDMPHPWGEPRNSLGEDDYRPGHGKPGASAAEPEPAEPNIDDNRFNYPVPPVSRQRFDQ